MVPKERWRGALKWLRSRQGGDDPRASSPAYLANDRKRVEDALSDDFRFASPFDDSIDKPTYFERCWKNATGSNGTSWRGSSSTAM